MIFDRIDDSNYMLFCARHYDNTHCHDIEEFYEDMRRIKYIKKLLTRYIDSGELKERLILNHLTILNNVFGPEALCKILFFKMGEQMRYIKPFLLLLNILPAKVYNVGKEFTIINTDEIEMDHTIIEALRKI